MFSSLDSYSHFRDHVKALELLKKVLELRQSKLGEGHPDTLVSMANLASRSEHQRYETGKKFKARTDNEALKK